jgi:hypothetical protein
MWLEVEMSNDFRKIFLTVNVELGAFVDPADCVTKLRIEFRPQLSYGETAILCLSLVDSGKNPYVLNESDLFYLAADIDFDHTNSLMILSENDKFDIAGTWADIDRAAGKISVLVDCLTTAFAAKLNGAESNSNMWFEIGRYIAGSTYPSIICRDKATAKNVIFTTEGTPESSDPEYSTTTQVKAFVRAGREFQFSVDGATLWHSTQVTLDRFWRERFPEGEWGVAIEMLAAAAGVASVNGHSGVVTGLIEASNNLSDLSNAATARSNLSLGDSAAKNVGTASGTVAAGDHAHNGVYEPADSSITKKGNTFNGASQLVALDANSKLPAVDGSQLTNMPGGASDTSYNGSNFTSTTVSSSQRVLQEAFGNIAVDTFSSNLTYADHGKLLVNSYSGLTFGSAALDNISASLVAAYKFNNGALTADSANNYTLTNNGAVASYATGKSGYCASFSGSNYFTMAWPSQTHPSFLCSAWLYLSSTGEKTIICGESSNNLYVMQFSVTSSTKLKTILNNTGGALSEVIGTTTLSTATWIHVAAYFNGSYIYIYLNGVLEATSSTAFSGTPNTATQWAIGARAEDAAFKFGGYIDELYYWRGASALFADASSALSAVQSLYNSGSGKFYGDVAVKKHTSSVSKSGQNIGSRTASAPAIAAGTGAGSSPTIAIAGSDSSGQITLTTGSSPATSATIATVTFNAVFPNTPYVILTAANAAAAALTGATQVYAASTTSAMTVTSGSTALTASTQYIWNYHSF